MTTAVTWKRKTYRLTPFRDGWRLRSRARGDEFDWLFPACSLAQARKLALQKFENSAADERQPSNTTTLEDVVTAYREIPKKAGAQSAYNNESRLRAVVRLALGKELSHVFVSEAGPKLWNAYMTKRQGGKLDLSLSGRKPHNVAINSAIRQAAAIFISRLRPLYKAHGILIPDDATVIQWLPEMKLPKPKAEDEQLLDAWLNLASNDPLYWTVGLARFAGLRQQEISMCRREWIVEDNGAVYIELRDRPEEGSLTKTGEMYRALIIHAAFAKRLLSLPAGRPIVETPPQMTRTHWFKFYPQEWLKSFTGTARKPLHRLRGLYADDVKKLTQDAVAAHLAGVKAASDALGHTNTATTKKSYLTA